MHSFKSLLMLRSRQFARMFSPFPRLTKNSITNRSCVSPDSSENYITTDLFPSTSTTGKPSDVIPVSTNAASTAASTVARANFTILNSVAADASVVAPSASISSSGAWMLRPVGLMSILVCGLMVLVRNLG